MINLLLTIRFEQAVYGSFPFWNRGYSFLCRSAGCRPEWLAEMRMACQRYGEPPSGLAEADSLFTLRLASGPWMIVGVRLHGLDDQDRPGAMSFHGLFVGRWAYLLAGANPFAFAPAIRREWTSADQDRSMPAVRFRPGVATVNVADADARIAAIVAALNKGRRVVLQSSMPIDELASAVWARLSLKVRSRTSVATWAFDNANRFQLIGSPKLTGMGLDHADLVIAREHADH
jgi:hypothetical protein